MLASPLAKARHFPEGEKQTAVNEDLSPLKLYFSFPLFTSHTLIVLSSKPKL